MHLILASQSPRRRELLALTGLAFEAMATDAHEQRQPGENPVEYACRLSRDKAQAAALLSGAPAWVLAADTIVVDGDAVLEKPADAAEAEAMLRRLRGRTHEVYTAITLLDTSSGQMVTEIARSPVPMRAYTDSEVSAYIASGDPFDKAGAYGIQHSDFHPSEGFAHCFANVMGLPLCHVTRILRYAGIEPPKDVPRACQAALGYRCPVHEKILAGEE